MRIAVVLVLLGATGTSTGCGRDRTAPDPGPASDGGAMVDGALPSDLRAPTFVAASTFPSAGLQRPGAVAVDATGDVLVLGQTLGNLDLGGGVSVAVSDPAIREYFLAMLDRDGRAVWAKSLGPISDDGSADATFDASGNILLLRQYEGELTIDGHPFEAAADGTRSAVVSFAPDGTIRWARSYALRLCELLVAPSGGYVLAGCSFVGSDFGTGVVDAPYLSGPTGFFGADGTLLKVIVEPYPCAHEMTPGGAFLVMGARLEPGHIDGTPIAGTEGEDITYLARLDLDGSVTGVESYPGGPPGDPVCDLLGLADGSIVGVLGGTGSGGTVTLTFGDVSFEGEQAFFRLGPDGALRWVDELAVQTLLRAPDDHLVMVAQGPSSGGDPFVFGTAVLPDENASLEIDAIVIGMDQDHAVEWGTRIEAAGDSGPAGAVDPTDGSVVLFGLVRDHPIDVPGGETLTGDEEGDLYLMRLRPP